jgi:hypothetical protein
MMVIIIIFVFIKVNFKLKNNGLPEGKENNNCMQGFNLKPAGRHRSQKGDGNKT